jgi:hypothetical protein
MQYGRRLQVDSKKFARYTKIACHLSIIVGVVVFITIWQKGDLLLITQILCNLSIIVGLVVAIWQLRLMKKGIYADHERRKKQATLEYCQEFNEKCNEFFEQIDENENLRGKVLNVCDVETNGKMQNAIRQYLSLMEKLAIGVNVGIYDLAVFDKIVGHKTVRRFERIKEAIDFFRKDNDNPYLYTEIQKLVSEIEKLRKQRFCSDEKDYARMRNLS